MNRTEATALVRGCLHEVAPDIPIDQVSPEDDVRERLYLDSLDFLRVVELLSERGGMRIDEEDYPRLGTIASAVDFLVGAPAGRARAER